MTRSFLLPGLALLLAGCASAPSGSPALITPEYHFKPQLAQLDLPKPDDRGEPEKVSPLGGAAAEMQAPHKPLTPTQESQAQLHVMAGEMAAGRRQFETAAREFVAALEWVDDADLARRATAMALSADQGALALKAARRWHALAPNEMDPREVIARYSLEAGDLAETQKQCEAIVAGHAGGVDEGLREVALLLAQAGDKHADGALKVMAALAAGRPAEAAAPHALGLLALRFGKLDLANQSARAALERDPDSRDHAMLLGGVLIRQGKLDEASAVFEPMIARDKDSAELRLAYARLLLESDHREAARTQTQKVLEQRPDSLDARYALGVMALHDRDFAAAEAYFKPMLETPRVKDAAYQLGRSAEAQRDFARALSYYERVDSGAQALEAALRRGYALAKLKRLPEARDLMLGLRQQLPQHADRFYLAESDILSESGDGAGALAVLDGALKAKPGDTELLYGRSLMLERQGRIADAEKDLRSILKKDPDDARAMNALGYMLTVHTKRLDEARGLISRALELDPDDPAILDSMGWVQFKLGKRKEALTLLEKAHGTMPDPEVAAHLGEVLWVLGDKDKARAVWDQALKSDPDHPVLKETIQRLRR